jgi:thioredoxin-like negative regulator of GroEL
MKRSWAMLFVALLLAVPSLLESADNLKLNPNLDYSDHNKKQGPLITGDHMTEGVVKGMPNYIIFYFEKCYNAKRQARITVRMYQKYRDFVHFVVVDVDQPVTQVQKDLIQKYCYKIIPHTTILDKDGKVVFDYTGETDEPTMDGWLDYVVRTAQAENQPQQAAKTGAGKSGGEN